MHVKPGPFSKPMDFGYFCLFIIDVPKEIIPAGIEILPKFLFFGFPDPWRSTREERETEAQKNKDK